MTKNLALKASVLAMGLGLSAYASAGNIVQVDFTGSGSAGSAVLADNLDWNQGNIMFQGMLPGTGSMTLLGQATGIFKNGSTGLNPLGYEVTYIFAVPVSVASSTSGTTDTYTYANGADGSGYFKAYISGKQAGGAAADNFAGTGFNDGVEIFSGTFNQSASVNKVDNDRTCLTPPITTKNPLGKENCTQLNIFDTSDGSPPSIFTTIFSGNAKFTVNITAQNSSYILNNINSFNVDFEDMTFNTSTFTQYADVSTSKQLRNSTDTGFALPKYGTFGGKTINGSCTVGVCDVMVEADASSAFDAGPPLPEPGTLALLALGLTGFGAMARRRKAK